MARARIDSLYAVTASSAIGGCAAVAATAAALTPPAVAIADRYLTLTAILVGATIITTIAMTRRRLERPERLGAVVVVLVAAGGWYSARLWVHEKQFDYLVGAQQRQLELAALELAGDIENFVHQRIEQAPPRPAPATWDRDVVAMLAFDNETSALFAAQFGMQVGRTRELFVLEGLTDRDFDTFYRNPANSFQIDVVARRLEVLARRLHRLERYAAR